MASFYLAKMWNFWRKLIWYVLGIKNQLKVLLSGSLCCIASTNLYYFAKTFSSFPFKKYLNYRKANSNLFKICIPLFFNHSFFLYISGTAWVTINLFTSFWTLFWRAFSWNKNLSNQVTKSADICKNVNLPIKCYLFGKIRHFEKFKNFFPWI